MRSIRGQTTSESVLLLPLFLFLLFGIIQIGLIGIALLQVNYGAASIARRVSRQEARFFYHTFKGIGSIKIENMTPSNGAISYQTQLDNLLIGAASNGMLRGCVEGDPSSLLTRDLTVYTSAEVPSLPFIVQTLTVGNNLFGGILDAPSTSSNGTSGAGPGGCPDTDKHILYFGNSTGHKFRVRGRATARLNYTPPE